MELKVVERNSITKAWKYISLDSEKAIIQRVWRNVYVQFVQQKVRKDDYRHVFRKEIFLFRLQGRVKEQTEEKRNQLRVLQDKV